MNNVFLGLGSNLSNPIQQLRTAYMFCQDISSACTGSSIYRSKPMGPVNQNDFYNAVCQLQTTLSPYELLDAIALQEQQQKRVKKRHWGERTIDIDILFYNDILQTDPALTLPHPGIEDRLFVLLPLAEFASTKMFADGWSVQTHLDQLLAKTPTHLIPIRQPQCLKTRIMI